MVYHIKKHCQKYLVDCLPYLRISSNAFVALPGIESAFGLTWSYLSNLVITSIDTQNGWTKFTSKTKFEILGTIFLSSD